MSMKELIEQGLAREIPPNNARARSLIESSTQSMNVMLGLKLDSQNSTVIFRELYECLRQTIEAIAYRKGYKFENHESLKTFIEEILQNVPLARDFDRCRKIRNGINYYGDQVSVETTARVMTDIPGYIAEISDN